MSLSALALGLTTVSAGAKIFGGIASKKAADDQAELLQEQARVQREETNVEAVRKTEERNRFIARQKVAFLANGVGLAGTGSIVIQDSLKEFDKEIAALRRSGSAKAGFLERESSIKKKSGRASLVSGVLGAGTTVAGNAFAAKEKDLF